MNQYFKTMYLAVVVLLLGSLSIHADNTRPLSLVVMDPLAAPLSCPCVEGYAQRKYEPIARSRRLRPDMSSPVVVGRHLFCVKRFLHCLDLESGLTEVWRLRDEALTDYAPIFATEERMLIVGNGQLLLMNTNGDKTILARQTVFAEDEEIYSHPALVGNKLFIRGKTVLRCISL